MEKSIEMEESIKSIRTGSIGENGSRTSLKQSDGFTDVYLFAQSSHFITSASP